MLIAIKGTPPYMAGPLDVVLVLHDVNTDRYHMAFFQEYPMPGPIVPVSELKIVRLKSMMHHTDGAETLEAALEHVDAFLAEKVLVAHDNVFRDAAVDWNGELGIVCIIQNWRQRGAEQPFNPIGAAVNLGSVAVVGS